MRSESLRRVALQLAIPDQDQEAIARLESSFPPHAPDPESCRYLVDYAVTEKVIPHVYRNAKTLAGSSGSEWGRQISEKLEEKYQSRLYERQNLYPQAMQTLQNALAQKNIPFLFIKGAHFSQLYSSDSPRQSNDIDFLVPDIEALFTTIDILSAIGFEVNFEDTPWIAGGARFSESARAEEPFLTGAIEMEYRPEASKRGVRVDIHVSNMPINHIGFSLTTDIWANALSPYPTWEDSLLILVGHAIAHSGFRQKDTNDLYLLLRKHGARLDWAYILRQAELYALTSMFKAMLSVIRKRYDPGLVSKETIHLFDKHPLANIITNLGLRCGFENVYSASIIHGCNAFWAYRPLGFGQAVKRARQAIWFPVTHFLSERFYEKSFLRPWLIAQEKSKRLSEIQTGERVNLVDPQEVCDEDDQPEPRPVDVKRDHYRVKNLAPNAMVIYNDDAEILSCNAQAFVTTTVGIFLEQKIEAAQELLGFADLSRANVASQL
jgi:hypothetical protein